MDVIIDRGAGIPLLRPVDVVVSPLCKGQPPQLALEPRIIRAFSVAVGEPAAADALFDQKALGLKYMDPVLLLAQLPLGSPLAMLLPYVGKPAKCISAMPGVAPAAIAALSNGVRSIALDARWGYAKGLGVAAALAESLGVEVQLIAPTATLPGSIYVRSNVPAAVRRGLVGVAPGDVGPGGEQFSPIFADLEGGEWEEPDYSQALERVAAVLGIKPEALSDVVELGALAYKTALDLFTARQLGYLTKWGLLEPIAGGFRASAKLLYLAALINSG
ncbi:MAG: hypothetical protein TU35_000975 [Thermoproteus sp. AZ2]|uniref:Uncharacterized protein n=1 Tax=Thermoproteus sp. AZ2 TaxID=1609232 RepID=A0ACC6UYK8_9CREN|nr:MAG: hypothetical protein TU35_06645 [Thermoproteus sp. AZ2]